VNDPTIRQYTVLLVPEPEEGGFSVLVPALPGCLTQGETVDEALANAREAIALHVSALRRHGDDVPEELAAPQLARVDVAV
jgi:antitoxin HicB